MCLSIPAKIVAIEGQSAQVEVNAAQRSVFLPVSNLQVGDWVLIHSGVVVATLDEAAALETLELLNSMSAEADS